MLSVKMIFIFDGFVDGQIKFVLLICLVFLPIGRGIVEFLVLFCDLVCHMLAL